MLALLLLLFLRFGPSSASSPCDLGSHPIMYHEYRAEDCTPRVPMGRDGACLLKLDAIPCQSYCEVRTMFTYAQEIPLSKSGYCHGPLTCSVLETDTKTYTYTGNGNIGGKLADVLDLGVSGGYSQAKTTTSTETKSVTLKKNECGYITFIPIVKTSCGSTTKGTLKVPGPFSPPWCMEPYHTDANICSTQPHRNPDKSHVLGVTVFVWTDCATNEVLPDDKQDPAYRYKDVRLPQAQVAKALGDKGSSKDPGSCGAPICL